MKQYPYILQLKSSAPVKDADGNYIEPSEAWVDYCICRDEANSGHEVKGVDGNSYAYSALIQMPKGVAAVAAGTLARVVDSAGSMRVQGDIIYSRKDQFHTRAWI